MLRAFDAEAPADEVRSYLAACNEQLAAMAREETDKTLDLVLYEASLRMKNGYSREDA